MSAHFYPDGNKEMMISILDNTPLLEYLDPFLALAYFRFDNGIDVYGGDYIIKHNEMNGLFMIRDTLIICLSHWDSFNNLYGVKKIDKSIVDEFLQKFNHVINYCKEKQVNLIVDAD